MNPDEVLNLYLNIINQNLDELQNSLASNGILEWFGKTFRTSRKIIEGFRYDLCGQYEHNFSKAEYCSPFDDSKETHLITRKIPPENLIELNIIGHASNGPATSAEASSSAKSESPGGGGASSSNNLDGYITPPQVKRIPILPKLTQGRKFMSDSDTDSDDPDDKTDETKKRKHRDDLQASGIKELSKSIGAVESERIDVNLCRNKISARTAANLKRNEANISRSDSEDEADVEQQPKTKIKKSDTSAETVESASDTSSNLYSELKYIQTIGMVKENRSKKHRGIVGGGDSSAATTSSTAATTSVSNDYSVQLTPSSAAAYERSACLKISYRLRLIDNHVQFALIIYDALNKNPKTRRNLFNEFQKSQLPNHHKSPRDATGSSSSSKKKSDTKSASSLSNSSSVTMSSKKSLRF